MSEVEEHPGFDHYLTVGEAAHFLGISPWTLRNWDNAGKLSARRHPKNGYRIYRHEELAALLSEEHPERLKSLTPHVNWQDMGENDHFVQFYENDDYLIESAGGFIAAALVAGDAAIMATTAEHRIAIEQVLSDQKIDVAAAIASGQFVSLDAAATLSMFMRDGSPDRQLFLDAVGDTLTSLKRGGRRVYAFGEMVAMLWTQGNRSAAIELEQLWCEMAKTQSFALFCAYPISQFADDDSAEALQQVCSCHTRVIPAESYAAVPTHDARLRVIASLQQKAQSLQAEIAHRHEIEKVLRDREQKQRELLESEKNARAELERLGKVKDEFLATVSHELRTPLNAIFGWIQLIKQAPADAKIDVLDEGVDVIDRNVRKQVRLIEDLLDLRRILSGNVHLDLKDLDLAQLLIGAAEEVAESAREHAVELHSDLDPSVRVCGDAARVRQIVWNLLDNAIKFTPAGSRVELRLRRNGMHAEISVTHPGQGIDPQFLPHIFDGFRQADSSITRQHGGLGIGLVVVKRLVDLHGGTIRASSKEAAGGAEFVVSLPLVVQTADAKSLRGITDNPLPDPATVNLKGIRVLVVDDDADSRRLVGRLLSTYQAEVIGAASASEAIEKLHGHKPHVLVSDIGMPETDGYQLIREIRSMGATSGGQIPAVALTAFARPDDRSRAMLAGFQTHISKPFEPRQLVATVANLARDNPPSDA